MPSHHLFSSHAVSLRRFTIGCGLVFIIMLAAFKAAAPRSEVNP